MTDYKYSICSDNKIKDEQGASSDVLFSYKSLI